MTDSRLAIIDLGSNTFHLLICEVPPDRTRNILYKERIYVKLASKGLGMIDLDSEQRAIEAMQRFGQHIRNYEVTFVRCIGTSALREAVNGMAVAEQLTAASGLPIEIIDGDREAGYIFRGITSALPALDRPALIMDIGGGSVEFILYVGTTILFKGSYKIGVAVLYKHFHHTDPIATDSIAQLEAFVSQELKALFTAVKSYPEYYLVGASGSFEVLHDVLPRIIDRPEWAELDMTGISAYLDEIIQMDIHSRRSIPEIPIERIDYIVVAYILIRLILKEMRPSKLFFCDYALKEGVLAEMVGERGKSRVVESDRE